MLNEGKFGFRQPKTKQEMGASEDAEQEGVNVRSKRKKEALPTSYLDIPAGEQRSWKKHRGKQYKVNELSYKASPRYAAQEKDSEEQGADISKKRDKKVINTNYGPFGPKRTQGKTWKNYRGAQYKAKDMKECGKYSESMINYVEKLDQIFEASDTYSYEKQRQKLKTHNEYYDAFNKEAKKYVDQMRPIYHRGGEDKIRKELQKIEKEIRSKLDKEERFKDMMIPDQLIAKLRVTTQGYDDVKSPVVSV